MMPELSGQVTQLTWSLTPLWWIPLLPFLGAVTNAIFGRRLQASGFGRGFSKKQHIGSAAVSLVAVMAVGLAFAIACANFAKLLTLEPGHRYLYSYGWSMVRIGSLDVSFAFAMDPLSAVVTLIITGVGALIHIYACSYMEHEPAYWRFFTYLNLFVFSMLLLVLADNLVVMFFGWEGVGLCSYLLIGFWYKDYKKATAGMKAFVVNRVGDFGFICGLSLLFWGLGGTWMNHGHYSPDYRARFAAVEAEPLSEGGEEHGHEAAQGAPHGAHEAAAGAHEATAHEPNPHAAGEAGGTGYLSFTSYPGAKVYLVTEKPNARVEMFDDQKLTGPNPPAPYAVSPFIHREIPAGVHSIAIVPGGGAVIGGDGIEVAHVDFLHVQAGKDMAISLIGPTVTFRDVHDQMVLKDHAGHAVLRDALVGKSMWGMGLVTLVCLLFFVGATGKSAQIPLYVWLPDAMAGPTPVSALIHAATMVTAGVYMIARLNFLFSLSPAASGVVALVGAMTALFAATIGFFQYDIKKVLAYSTVSQLGFMFIGVGVGAYWAGVFHLMTHAFFKACLFLGSGSVIHGMHHVEHDEVAVQDMRNMGGLRRVMPITAMTYRIACLAITAAPIPLFAGFWSKDEILWKAFTTENTGVVPGMLIYAMGLAAAVGTSFYMWRSYYLTFEGPHANEKIATKVHESPAAITYVLIVLAFLSATAGVVFGFSSHLLGGHGEPLLEAWLMPVLAHAETKFASHGLGLELGLMALSVGLAVGSWAFAKARYGENRSKNWAAEEQRVPGFTLLQNKYYVDEIYAATIVRAFLAMRIACAEFDTWVVDGLVNLMGLITRGCAWITGAIDTYLVDGAVNFVAQGILKAGDKLRTVQTGRVQNYVYGALGGVAFFAIVQYFLG